MITSIKRTLGFITQHPLAKRHLVKSYLNLLSWQLTTIFFTKPVVRSFIGSTKFLAKKGLTGITGNIYAGLHEFEDMAFLLHFLRSDDIFFDVGANVGSYTILASGVKGAQTVAFEPIPQTYSMLVKNMELNSLHELVTCVNKGVGQKEEKLNFTTTGDTTNHIVPRSEQNSITVDIEPLDKYYPLFKPTIVKIDVEGFETEVLNGANEILQDRSLKAIIIELNGSGGRYGFSDQYIHEKLTVASFKPYSYDPYKRELKKLNSFGNFNTIYIRDLDIVMERLRSAQPFIVFNETI